MHTRRTIKLPARGRVPFAFGRAKSTGSPRNRWLPGCERGRGSPRSRLLSTRATWPLTCACALRGARCRASRLIFAPIGRRFRPIPAASIPSSLSVSPFLLDRSSQAAFRGQSGFRAERNWRLLIAYRVSMAATMVTRDTNVAPPESSGVLETRIQVRKAVPTSFRTLPCRR